QGSTELKALAEIALAHNIPLINATYPSDGRVTGNNRMVILNSTLKTHCEGLYRNLQINHSTDNLVLITRTGTVENFLKASMEEAGKNTRSVALKWTEQVLPDAFTPEQLVALLDSTRTNTIIGATLDKNFSLRLIKTIAGMSAKYRVNIMGMPTWDEYALNKAEFKGSTVYFSTPFVSYSANAALYNAFNKRFTNILKSKPSDMAYKGYEIVYRYTRTLKDYPTPEAFMENINKPAYRMFADFNVQPVTAADGTVNYLENKKIYWVKKVDGNIVWVGN
ncbi:MAG TPA: hypothetical protein PKD90_19465, partial [Phnomibacter sp.]|nr:hypothetical protein [Phnomibacter sp.]